MADEIPPAHQDLSPGQRGLSIFNSDDGGGGLPNRVVEEPKPGEGGVLVPSPTQTPPKETLPPVTPPVTPTPPPAVVPPSTSPSTPPALTSETISDALTKSLTAAGLVGKPVPVEPPAPKVVTPEEARKLLRIMDIDDAFIAEFGNLETQKAALIKFRDGVFAQADTVAQVRINEALKVIEERFGPVITNLQQQEQVRLKALHEEAFAKAYPGVAGPAYEPLRSMVIADLQSKKTQFATVDESYAAVANGVAAIVKTRIPDFDPKVATAAGGTPAPVAQSSPTNNNPNALSGTTPGSAGGGGDKPSVQEKKKGMAIFDPVP